jgi:hypothetical protein
MHEDVPISVDWQVPARELLRSHHPATVLCHRCLLHRRILTWLVKHRQVTWMKYEREQGVLKIRCHASMVPALPIAGVMFLVIRACYRQRDAFGRGPLSTSRHYAHRDCKHKHLVVVIARKRVSLSIISKCDLVSERRPI